MISKGIKFANNVEYNAGILKDKNNLAFNKSDRPLDSARDDSCIELVYAPDATSNMEKGHCRMDDILK
jgi:hypothetical protein